MPYKNIHWIKLEKRLLNDHRFYMMSEASQLIYVKFLMLAAQYDNKIPRSEVVLRSLLRTELEPSDIALKIKEIRKNYPKLMSNKHFYYFKEWGLRHNWVIPGSSQGVPRDGADKIREDKIRKEKKREGSHPTSFKDIIKDISKRAGAGK